jgi:hypothetical protein
MQRLIAMKLPFKTHNACLWILMEDVVFDVAVAVADGRII